MKPYSKRLGGLPSALALSLTCLAGLTTATAAQAGSATLDADGHRVTFEYNDSMVRINNSADTSSYVVMRDGTMYTVSMAAGAPMVMDAGSMLKGMGNMPGMESMTPPTGATDFDGRFVSLNATGASETVAGVKGEVYELVLEEDNGVRRTETLVLSTDERAIEFRDAMLLMVNIAAAMAPNQEIDNAIEQRQELEKRLRDMNAGVLRFGNQMSIAEISGDAIPAARFELPAPPMDMQGFGSMLGEMQKRMQQR